MKKGAKLYDYLEECGVLTNGTSMDIEKAKKKYWAIVRKEWRKKQRQECKSYTVFLNTKEQELINIALKQHKQSITSFIKQSAILAANGNKGVNKERLGEIRQVFFESFNGIETMMQNNEGSKVAKTLVELEKRVLELIK